MIMIMIIIIIVIIVIIIIIIIIITFERIIIIIVIFYIVVVLCYNMDLSSLGPLVHPSSLVLEPTSRTPYKLYNQIIQNNLIIISY